MEENQRAEQTLCSLLPDQLDYKPFSVKTPSCRLLKRFVLQRPQDNWKLLKGFQNMQAKNSPPLNAKASHVCQC